MIVALLAPRAAAGLAAGAGAALLLAAFAFQHLGGLQPCALCVYQRWPHLLLALLCGAGAVWAASARPALAFGALTCAAGAGLAGFHVGVQQGWWAGLQGCSGLDLSVGSVEALRAQLLATPVTTCDSIDWTFLSLSMPAWNMIASAAIAGFCAAAALRSRRA